MRREVLGVRRVRREPSPSTTRFIALLRALWLAVAAYGVSHAQVERRLCGWIADGQKAVAMLRDSPPEKDREELQFLISRKTATEESGLARTDGRRDRAGGQRIGELLAGKFPRGAMPSRRRAEVCLDVLLEILEEKAREGYAAGRYGTRELWLDLWLEADQRRIPEIDPGATTVLGYLEVAQRQLADMLDGQQADGVAAMSTQQWVIQTEQDTAVTEPAPDQHPESARAEARQEADRLVAQARAERDEALARATTAEETATTVREAAERETAELRAALAGQRRRATLLTRISVALAGVLAGVVATWGALLAAGVLDPSPTHTVQLAATPREVTAGQQAAFAFLPALPEGREWTLSIQLRVNPTDLASGCTYGAQMTAHVEADGTSLPPFTSDPGQTAITQTIPLGKRGSRDLQLIVTRVGTDPGCVLQLDPGGSQATSTG
jgi:hypothetical protein